MRQNCRVCGRIGVREHLDFGPQAIRNRFLRSADELEFTHRLRIGYCGSCGMVQLTDPPPVREVRPQFEWISYNEPERHLDELARVLAKLPSITRDSTFAGLTYKDDSTLARLNRLGFVNTWRPDIRTDLGIDSPFAGIESVQETLRSETADALAAKFGRPDVLLARHVLEHTHDTPAALEWAAKLVRPGGYVVFEVPDTVRALDRLDYTTVWEEHTLYFTPTTLRACVGLGGFEILGVDTYPYTLENSLVVIARSGAASWTLPNDVAGMARADRFVSEFQRIRERTRRQLRDRGRVAMLGAGHLTGAFLNLYGLAEQIEFVTDDNANKQGLFMPGSRLPILPSSELVNRDIDLCLMTVRPEIEDAVAAKNATFTERGGVLASVFPDSPYSLERASRPVGVLA
ncbi:MAG: class I SAM-dependent methyltransferase [Planctomycetes bacterium]|nr:class I SAM-dependent methyltransferase [Planctomycetota bacterium]